MVVEMGTRIKQRQEKKKKEIDFLEELKIGRNK